MNDEPKKNLSPRSRARRAALQAIYQWQSTGQSPNEIEQQFASDKKLRRVDKTLFHALLYNVAARVDDLDRSLTPFADRGIAEIDPVERAILRIGAYELSHHPEVPWRVVINEAVELAKCFGAQEGHKYVNAVLDPFARARPRAQIGGDESRHRVPD